MKNQEPESKIPTLEIMRRLRELEKQVDALERGVYTAVGIIVAVILGIAVIICWP